MPQYHDQVAGGSCSMTMYVESRPGCVASGTPGVRLAFMSETFGKQDSKRQSAVITGKRGAGKPQTGLPQFTGQVQAAAYSPQLGYLFMALCGPAISVTDPARALASGAVQAVTAESGCAGELVGLPCPGHGFVQDAVITVHGTQNYDGEYRVAYGVTEDLIVINAPYVPETLGGDEIVCRGRAPLLLGDAVNLGSGKVGLPVQGGMHSLNTGDRVSISGTFSYDGVHTLTAQCGEGMLVIDSSYTAETFDGTVPAIPLFYRHSFVLPPKQPTLCMEKYLDYDDGLGGVDRYQRYGFCKVSGLSYNLGGDGELTFTVDFAVGKQTDSQVPLDDEPREPAAVPFDNIEASLWRANVRRGDVETGSFTNNLNVRARVAIGDLGQYSRMAEGNPECSATLQAFLEEVDWKYMSGARLTLPFAVGLCAAAGDECWFRYPESEVDALSQPINGKEGLMQQINVFSFVDCKNSVLTLEIINRVSAYTS